MLIFLMDASFPISPPAQNGKKGEKLSAFY
jgi:hypothetical protein